MCCDDWVYDPWQDLLQTRDFFDFCCLQGQRYAKVCLSTCCVEQHPVPQAVQCSPRGHAELPVLVTNKLIVGPLHSQELDQSCSSAVVEAEPAAPILQCTDRLRPLKHHGACNVFSTIAKHSSSSTPS